MSEEMTKRDLIPCCHNCGHWQSHGNNMGGCKQQRRKTGQVVSFGPACSIEPRPQRQAKWYQKILGIIPPQEVYYQETQANDVCYRFLNRWTVYRRPTLEELGCSPCGTQNIKTGEWTWKQQ